MEFRLTDNSKILKLKNIFTMLNESTDSLTFMCQTDKFYTQGMDRSHIYLYELNLMAEWFSFYNVETPVTISVDGKILSSIFKIYEDGQILCMKYTKDEDTLSIEFIKNNVETQELLNTENVEKIDAPIISVKKTKGKKKANDDDNIVISIEETLKPVKKPKKVKNVKKTEINFENYFNIPLMDIELELLNIPTEEYDLIFDIDSKPLSNLLTNQKVFSDTLNIKNTDTDIIFSLTGDIGNMTTKLNIDSLDNYEKQENTKINMSFAVNIVKLIINDNINNKLTISLTQNNPLKVHYDLEYMSSLDYYLAPKIDDDNDDNNNNNNKDNDDNDDEY